MALCASLLVCAQPISPWPTPLQRVAVEARQSPPPRQQQPPPAAVKPAPKPKPAESLDIFGVRPRLASATHNQGPTARSILIVWVACIVHACGRAGWLRQDARRAYYPPLFPPLRGPWPQNESPGGTFYSAAAPSPTASLKSTTSAALEVRAPAIGQA